MALTPVRLVFDNSNDPFLGVGSSPPLPANGGLLSVGNLCSPKMPSTPPPDTLWIPRGPWTVTTSVAPTATGGQGVKLYTPNQSINGVANGDGVVPVYSGAVKPGGTLKGVGGLASLPPDYRRHVTWPAPFPMAEGMELRMVNRTYQGGSTVFHAVVDQIPLSADQSIVKLGASWDGTGYSEVLNLFDESGWGESSVPEGYVLYPLAVGVNDHTGAVEEDAVDRIADISTMYSTLARISAKLRPRSPNNNAIGGYLGDGTAPGPYTKWQANEAFIFGADDYPRVTVSVPEGDRVTAFFIGLLQPATDTAPYAIQPLPS